MSRSELADVVLADMSYEHLAMVACEELAGAGYQFHIGGFGDDDWPVDVAYDLSSVVEELPRAMDALKRRTGFEIDLYGQGIERTLVIEPAADRVRILCRSWTSWTPMPSAEEMSHTEFFEMVTALATAVAQGLAHTGSPIARLPPFDQWIARDSDCGA